MLTTRAGTPILLNLEKIAAIEPYGQEECVVWFWGENNSLVINERFDNVVKHLHQGGLT